MTLTNQNEYKTLTPDENNKIIELFTKMGYDVHSISNITNSLTVKCFRRT
jgi:hypothetical protein